VLNVGERRRFVVIAIDAPRRGIDLALPGVVAVPAGPDAPVEEQVVEALGIPETSAPAKAPSRRAKAAVAGTGTKRAATKRATAKASPAAKRAPKKSPAKATAGATSQAKGPARKKTAPAGAGKKAPPRKAASAKAASAKASAEKASAKKATARKAAAKATTAKKAPRQ
jgi:hypothetical protein